MSEAVSVPTRVSLWQHVASATLIFVFVGAAALRLNECDLFNPDSPRYLIYAQGLLETGDYRAVDVPGEPLYTWRPPGLPLLLTPALYFKPYDLVAAKVAVLVTAALLLLAVHALASSTAGGWSGPVAVAAVASSPIFLVLSTEVLTEVPYALGTLAVIYWLGRCSERSLTPQPLHFVAVLMALAFLPFVRTVAVSLVVAVGLWCVVSRRRWPFSIAVGIAIAGIVWQAQRGDATSGDNYSGKLQATLSEHGLLGVVREALGQVMYYASTVADVLLPGLTHAQPFYARLIIDASPTLSGVESLCVAAACGIVLLGLVGLWATRASSGGLALVYIPLYCGCLAIWPWRHERFLWVLAPLVWSFVPAGLAVVSRALQPRNRAALNSTAVLSLLALCAWNVRTDAHLIATNQRFLARGDAFYVESAPSFYFSDFRKAGEWIRDHTAEHARVLTWHASTAGTAHRYQKRVSFETQTPEKIRQQVEAFSARYLVVPTAQFHDGFGWQQIDADPAIAWKVVYQGRDVAVLEVEPNRTGAISRTAYEDWLAKQQSALDDYLELHPERTDLIVRRSTLLAELGHTDEAISSLRGLVDRGVVTVRVCADLGWLLLDQKQYADAARFLNLARGLPNAEAIAGALAEGARYAREKARTPPNPPLAGWAKNSSPPLNEGGLGGVPDSSGAITRDLQRVQAYIASLKFAQAERVAARLMDVAPDHPEANYWRGYLHHLFGEFDQATVCYERSVQFGSKEARAKLRLLRWAEVFANGQSSEITIAETSEKVDPGCGGAHVELAKQFDEHGWPGRALATLEAARERFGDDTELLVPLANLYRRFAQPENAAPLYRLALERTPNDADAQMGLDDVEAALRTPRF